MVRQVDNRRIQAAATTKPGLYSCCLRRASLATTTFAKRQHAKNSRRLVPGRSRIASCYGFTCLSDTSTRDRATHSNHLMLPRKIVRLASCNPRDDTLPKRRGGSLFFLTLLLSVLLHHHLRLDVAAAYPNKRGNLSPSTTASRLFAAYVSLLSCLSFTQARKCVSYLRVQAIMRGFNVFLVLLAIGLAAGVW